MQTTTQNTESTIKISDMRGDYYAGNFILIFNDKPNYCGSPIQDLIRDKSTRSNYLYNIIQYGVNVGTIALTDSDKKILTDLLNPIQFTRINNDTNGNPRFVCHFLAFIGDKDRELELQDKYNVALARSRQLGDRKSVV